MSPPRIVFFGEDWGRHPSTGQLARELARRTPVVWVNSLGLRAPRLRVTDGIRIAQKLAQYALSAGGRAPPLRSPVPPNLHLAAPLAIPLYRYRAARALNRGWVSRYLRTRLATLGLDRPVVITAAVEAAGVLDRLGAVGTLYYCADDYTTMPGVDPELVQRLEREVLRQADMVVVASGNLQGLKRQLQPDVRYLPHGVDHGRFSQALRPTARPTPLAALPSPTVGFVGSIGEHIDFDLLESLASQLAGTPIVMVGPVEAGTDPPPRDNIHYLGAVPYEAVPDYLACFDVCIVPFRSDTGRIRYASPTKLREYLAAGRPVVSTPQPEAEKLASLVTFAGNHLAFAAAVRAALAGADPRACQARSAAMQEHSWARRAETLLAWVEEVVKRKGLKAAAERQGPT